MAAQAKHLMSSTLLLSLLTLAGCNKPVDPQQPKVALAPTAQPAQPYTPPTAEQLSQMVAPIALFPDKLVGQVLAGATYPAQISEADQWLAQNPSLKGDALQSAEANQPWDVSVKSLTAFPSVLDQMAANPQWTTSLGQAYANDPNDVMNAIQVMRQRAQQAGNLKTTPKLRVSTTLRATPPPDYIDEPPPDQVVYAGPAVIPPPPQTIIIEPAEPDVVYVPQYNPTVVYGEPVAVYPGWRYREPAYVGSDLVTTGAITFGIGVLVGAAFSHHHDYGWNSWGVNWGGPAHGGGGWHRPAVVYNNNTYISKSVTVNNYGPRGGALAAHAQPPMPMQLRGAGPMAMQPHPSGPMTMPHFTRHDAVPGARPPMMAAQHGAGPQGAGRPDFRQPPQMAQQMQPHGASTMHMPQAIQQRQPAQQLAQQHNQPGQEHARFGEQRPTAQQHGSANMANQLGAQQHNPAVQQHQQAQQQQQRQQEHNMAQRQAAQQQQRLHEQQRQQMASRQPPAMHADAGAAHAALPHRDANPPQRAQAHVMHQEAQAMPARPAGPPQPSHEQRQAPRHEQAAHQEQHDKHEHHG